MKKLSEEKKQKFRLLNTLRWRLTLFVFLILIVSGVTTGLVYTLLLLLFRFHPLVVALTVNPYSLVITLLCICSVIGTILASRTFLSSVSRANIRSFSQNAKILSNIS